MIKNCPMRHENGNCLPAGGFCTANKNICEALRNAYRLGKAQLSQEDTTSDLISRQAAIDIEQNATVDTNPSHFEAHQKFTQFMDDAEISSFGRWQWSNGFNTALTAVGIDLKKLPPAQLEPQEGHWIDKGWDGDWAWQIDGHGNCWRVIECSECGKNVLVESNFCPHCGAKMKGN